MRELPLALERTIHFLPPHNEKICAKVAGIIPQVDVLLGNLEDAIPIEAKAAAREGFIAVARQNDFSSTGLWTRVNALNSPWFLDDVTEIVAHVGSQLDVIMVPKVEGAWDIHYVDQLLAQLEARHEVSKPIMVHAILETAEGVKNVDAIAAASPRMHGMSLGPADLAASRGMKTTRVGGGHPFYGVLADASDAATRTLHQGPLALYRREDGGRVPGLRAKASTDCLVTSRSDACESQFRNAFLQGCGCVDTHPSQIAIAKQVFSPDVDEVLFARKILTPCRMAAVQS